MKWKVEYSHEAIKFIKKHDIHSEVREEIKKIIMRIQGNNINVDLKKLTGNWSGYHRLRKGNLRIIFEINKTNKVLFIERIDFRGNIYK